MEPCLSQLSPRQDLSFPNNMSSIVHTNGFQNNGSLVSPGCTWPNVGTKPPFLLAMQLCVKGSMRPSPLLSCDYVNQHHNNLTTVVGLSLHDHINPLMAALIACRLAGSIREHETECHMVESITWFTIRTLLANERLYLLHWFNFLVILDCTWDNCVPFWISLPIINPRYLKVILSGTQLKSTWGFNLGFFWWLN